MFLTALENGNEKLLETAIKFHKEEKIQPDSYIIDVDMLLENSKLMLSEAKKRNIRMFFMIKQIGRNPYIAKKLVEIGYEGAVAVDFKEAKIMMQNNIPLSHVGHLVQIPKSNLLEIIKYKTEYITVYSIEKAREINEICEKLGTNQKILIKVYDKDDTLYDLQESGFFISNIKTTIEELKKLENITVAGVTSFPCYLSIDGEFKATNNVKTINKACDILRECGIIPELINMPSATCVEVLSMIEQDGGNSAEPGHGLTGTTPSHVKGNLKEKISVLYLSEISHNHNKRAYCYGGGHYRRSNVTQALNILSDGTRQKVDVQNGNNDSIDYYFALSKELEISSTIIMAFRFQMFVTRSDVVLIEGISNNKPEIVGVYTSLGGKI